MKLALIVGGSSPAAKTFELVKPPTAAGFGQSCIGLMPAPRKKVVTGAVSLPIASLPVGPQRGPLRRPRRATITKPRKAAVPPPGIDRILLFSSRIGIE